MHISRKVIPSIKLEKETRSVIRMGYPSSKPFCDNFISLIVYCLIMQHSTTEEKNQSFSTSSSFKSESTVARCHINLKLLTRCFHEKRKTPEFSRIFNKKRSFSLIKNSGFVIQESMRDLSSSSFMIFLGYFQIKKEKILLL